MLCFPAAYLPDGYQPSQVLLDKLQPLSFSKRITVYHCPTCGSLMLVSKDGENAGINTTWCVVTGTLEQAEGVLELHDHGYVADTLDGGFSDFLVSTGGKAIGRWPHNYGEGAELPAQWQSPSRPKPAASAEDRLHAHCLCGGIDFYIARPSERSARDTAAWPDLIIPFNSDKPHPPWETWWLQQGAKKFLAGVCSCDSCRLASGLEFVEWAFIPTIDITLDAEGKKPFTRDFGTLKHYRSSSVATRHFCGTCGATIFWDGDERPQLIDVAVGLLNAPEGARAETWLQWRTERLSYREDAMPRAESIILGVEAGLTAHGKRMQGEHTRD